MFARNFSTIAALAFLMLAISGPDCPASGNAAKQNAVILVFGDSLAAGNMLPAADREHLWVRRAARDSGGRLTPINEGKGGRPTGSVADFKAALARHPGATALAIMLGTNDSRDTSAQCVAKATANITAMIEHARAVRGADFSILLIAPPNINKDALGPSKPIASEREANLRNLADAYRALSEKHNTRFATLHGILPPETLAKDGVHPDARGNDLIAAALLPDLLKLQYTR